MTTTAPAPRTPAATSPDAAATAVPTAAPDGAVEELLEDAVALAHRWWTASTGSGAGGSRRERASSARLAGLVRDRDGVEFALRFVDRVARPEDDAAAARELAALARDGVPAFLGPVDRAMVAAGGVLAPRAPGVVVPLARRRLRQLVGHLVVDAGDRALGAHLARARAAGQRLNLNLLGEAVLGHAEADRRLARTAALLDRPDVDYVSVKASAVAAQLVTWDLEGSRDRLLERLLPLYRRAAAKPVPAFVNLDMEEHADLDVTVALVEALLAQEDLTALPVGVVLQAYLPDAAGALERLTAAAADRRARGGAPLKVRLVKGANLAMERVGAEAHGWPQAPYASKAEVDASYVRLLDTALVPGRTDAVRIGAASHNLFDVALAHLLAQRRGVADALDVEMLQGMAPAQVRAVGADVGRLVLYTPVVDAGDFDAAVSYLVRRLEENAAPENFVRALFDGAAGGAARADQEGRFRGSVTDRWRDAAARSRPRRTQDRAATEPAERAAVPAAAREEVRRPSFANAPDTDPSLAANRAWALAALARDPGAPRSAVVTDPARVDAAVQEARAAGAAWAAVPAPRRAAALRAAARALEGARGALVAVMAHEGGKTLDEADPEVSEAVDFAAYYADRALELDAVAGAAFTPHRLVVVTPPWNFPVAIPLGGALAALAAGSAAVLKPAPQAVRCAEVAVAAVSDALAAAGAPAGLLRVLRTDEEAAGRRLVTHPGVDAVVLTGSSETARLFASWRPDLPLVAETSGKNALVVTPSADLDLAVADAVRSAFGHAGQKCSAASLLIAVGSVATSARFRRQLVDAVTSLRVGPGTDVASRVGPLIAPPGPALLRALTRLEDGERWLVRPRPLDGLAPERSQLWSPGVKEGVRPGSWSATQEWFGPVLGIVAVADLDEALAVQNTPALGLTGGLHSLDEAEVEHWLERVDVGCAYVNRHTTGAVVQRQPFGGWKDSVRGPGAKAGGPHYVAQLGVWADTDEPAEGAGGPVGTAAAALLQALAPLVGEEAAARLRAAAASDEEAWEAVLRREHDPSALLSEVDVLRYRPLPLLRVRAGAGAPAADLARVLLAATRTGTALAVSTDSGRADLRRLVETARAVTPGLVASLAVQDDAAAAADLGAAAPGERVRLLGSSPAVLRAAADGGLSPLPARPLTAGRRELLALVREQSVSRTAHRFGHPLRRTSAGAGSPA